MTILLVVVVVYIMGRFGMIEFAAKWVACMIAWETSRYIMNLGLVRK